MQRRWHRPFTILDAMILVGASAVGLALARTILDDALRMPHSPMWVARPITYFLFAWTIAFIPLRLRRPQPRLERLMLQPGMAACTAVFIVAAIDAIAWTTYEAQHWPRFAESTVSRFWRGESHHPGPVVAMTWLGLVLSRRWRPESSWLDRLGRTIGVLWLLTLLCDWRFGRWTFNITYRLWTGHL
jgi:hypothetical protein